MRVSQARRGGPAGLRPAWQTRADDGRTTAGRAPAAKPVAPNAYPVISPADKLVKLANHLPNHGVPHTYALAAARDIAAALWPGMTVRRLLSELQLLREPALQAVLDRYRQVPQPKPYRRFSHPHPHHEVPPGYTASRFTLAWLPGRSGNPFHNLG